MNKNELAKLLEELAIRDLADGAELHDHPCSVAGRAIRQCFADIKFLRGVVNGSAIKTSKRAKMILGLNYNPSW